MASIILGMGLGLCSLSQAQMGGMGGGMGGGMPSVPGTTFGGATDPSSMQTGDGLHFVPSVQISELYDSNVFSAPKSRARGLTLGDFITTVVPQVRALYADREKLVRVNVVAGAVGSYYLNNTGLSYVGANVGAVLDMSDLLSRWRPGARWTVSDTFAYTPQSPAFLVGDQSGEQVNPLLTGFQATRSNRNSNSVNTVFELPLSSTINLTGSYTNSFIRYGASQVPQAATLISQEAHVYTAGLIMKASVEDSVKVDFIGNEFDQGLQGAFSARGGTLGWMHRFSPTVSFNAAGGAQLLSGQLRGVPFSPVIAPVGSLAIFWSDSTTSLTLAYRSGVTPSLQFRGASLLNHMVSFSVVQNTPIRDLAGLLGANYSYATEYGSNFGGDLSWKTVGGTAGLRYRVTQKMFLTLSYVYQNVDNVFEGTHFAFDKHAVQLNLTQAFY